MTAKQPSGSGVNIHDVLDAARGGYMVRLGDDATDPDATYPLKLAPELVKHLGGPGDMVAELHAQGCVRIHRTADVIDRLARLRRRIEDEEDEEVLCVFFDKWRVACLTEESNLLFGLAVACFVGWNPPERGQLVVRAHDGNIVEILSQEYRAKMMEENDLCLEE